MADSIRRPVTAHDVARLAGVSQSAVSRTYTKGASVAPSTREKVEAAAAELGYRPNFVARSLITRRSNLIGVVVPSMANPFYSEVLEALSKAFEAMEYRVLLFSTVTNEDSDPILEEVLRHRVEALILVSATLSSHFAEECKQTGLPVVLLNRKNDNETVSSVTSDNAQGGALIADFLVSTHHKKLAFIAGHEGSSTSRDRERSFLQRLHEHGLPAPLREVGNYSFQDAMEATRRLMSLPTPPDAIFCANDLMAIAALNVVSGECSLTPGKDISIVGFDDIEMSRWPIIGLTTYQQPIHKLVQRTVDVIRAQLNASTTPSIQEVFGGQLVIRGSARLPKSGLKEIDGNTVWRMA
ncbi:MULTISPECIES: LacI family DNA-binding transcriptional regulator [unclassified Pseudomonas]|uniref:LacI family DNA-binding transcriptional regulator n=1 Tax=unclassified Pseudomonas TaxID=196821 RepID=UPI00215C8AEC|nr:MULTISPECIES: LacI family DNA-binding transcriptional regulator [unclassified Pseudomonas]MCR8932235.1 LacI family DNA-binding transcriptional regulator [Pseudomonas sp. S11A4]MCR8975843.1 LacI family DNA-binding transcriptional regulator [Pseudomonas sp. S11P7]